MESLGFLSSICKPMSPGAIVLAWNGEAPEVEKPPFHFVNIGIPADENRLIYYYKCIVGNPVHFSASTARCYEAGEHGNRRGPRQFPARQCSELTFVLFLLSVTELLKQSCLFIQVCLKWSRIKSEITRTKVCVHGDMTDLL